MDQGSQHPEKQKKAEVLKEILLMLKFLLKAKTIRLDHGEVLYFKRWK